MRGFLIRAAVVALGLWLASRIVPGIAIDSAGTLIAAALLLGIVNAILRPILVILTLPITLLTLGIFLLVINGLMIELVAWLLPGFHVPSLWPATLTAIVVSVTSWVVTGFIGGSGQVQVVTDPRVIELSRTRDGHYQ
jgi:putative membrane protein